MADKAVGAPAPAPLRSLLGYLREHRMVLAVVVVLSILGAVITLTQPLVVNRVIESVGNRQPLAFLVGLLVALVLSAGLLGAVQQYLLARTAEGVVLSLRRRLTTRLLRLPVRVFDTHRSGDLVSRVGSDTTMVRTALTGGLVDALGGALIFVGSLIAMLLLDPALLGLTMAVVAVAVISVVVASARVQANLFERITDHPDGLDATVGDDGAGLSGGERQRLAIARALLADTPLLLLDEPTASLDSRNEQALHEAIRSAASSRTVLIVAHRLATVAGADQIAVLDHGHLTATGTHNELLHASDLYRELAHHQLLV